RRMLSSSPSRSNSAGDSTTATGSPFSRTVTGSFRTASISSRSLICPVSFDSVRIVRLLCNDDTTKYKPTETRRYAPILPEGRDTGLLRGQGEGGASNKTDILPECGRSQQLSVSNVRPD